LLVFGVLVRARRVQVSVCVYVCMYVCIYVCIHRRALVVDRETNAQTELNTQYVPRCVHDTEAPQTTSYQPPGETRPGAITKNTAHMGLGGERLQGTDMETDTRIRHNG